MTLKQIRKVITGALEKKRADKIIGSSLEAHIDIYLEKSILEKVKNYQLDEISITSSFELHEINSNSQGFSLEEVPHVKVEVSKTSGQKCQRCWKYKKQLIRDEICSRCDSAIS
jgi:isoleucyl-tRNA synthetase